MTRKPTKIEKTSKIPADSEDAKFDPVESYPELTEADKHHLLDWLAKTAIRMLMEEQGSGRE